jgi:c-di-GMP-binding flagellar brake protein YcgR
MSTVQEKKQAYQFQIWERLRLTVGEEGQEGTYSCRISDIRPDRLVISRPVYERGKTLMADNRLVIGYSIRADAAYAFSARLKETEPKSADEMYLMNPGPVKRVQRRRFVRLDKLIHVKYAPLPRPISKPINPTFMPLAASRSINLSAGGMLITLESDLSTDDILFLTLEAGGFQKLPRYMLGACRHTGKPNNLNRVAGIEFILQEDLPRYLSHEEIKMIPAEGMIFNDQMQNELVAEIFNEQLVMRQKGIL